MKARLVARLLIWDCIIIINQCLHENDKCVKPRVYVTFQRSYTILGLHYQLLLLFKRKYFQSSIN